jgi:hypothetical protein
MSNYLRTTRAAEKSENFLKTAERAPTLAAGTAEITDPQMNA